MENTIINPHNELSAPVKRNLPRDVFLHLFAMVALYWVAISFITLCWQYINYFFPDPLLMRYAGQFYAGPIRFAVASLIIIFPLFVLTSWYLNTIYRRDVSVRESKIRKWLIYLTLFVASMVIMGDLVMVIYSFLGGDTTIRFLLKSLSVLVVSGAIFGYYLDDVRRNQPSPAAKHVAITSSLVILGMVIGAFFIVGSPMQARSEQFDQQRVADLQNIQWQVVNYWQSKEAMPSSLADLSDSISGYTAPVDPETGNAYEYRVKNAAGLNFELCATFDLEYIGGLDGRKSMPAYPVYDGMASQNWDHAAGRVCFDRTIDRQLYPPMVKGK